ncbi:MAG: Uma2 family endonuclease [Candidatus Poribacteria bacterium]|nr:Uma2 family endonuclease [Candidatus Poribacteria bacterium]
MLNSQTNPDSIQEMPTADTMTLEEFLENDLEGYEYVKGELVPMPLTSMEHGEISSNVLRHLGLHVFEHQLGRSYTEGTTFHLGDRVVKPDVAFVSTERLPENRDKGSPIPPDLAVEVVSPADKQYDVTEKAFAYLKAGTRLVWVLEPVAKTVMVYRSETDFTLLTCEDTLTGEDVVEGFACSVAELFE